MANLKDIKSFLKAKKAAEKAVGKNGIVIVEGSGSNKFLVIYDERGNLTNLNRLGIQRD